MRQVVVVICVSLRSITACFMSVSMSIINLYSASPRKVKKVKGQGDYSAHKSSIISR